MTSDFIFSLRTCRECKDEFDGDYCIWFAKNSAFIHNWENETDEMKPEEIDFILKTLEKAGIYLICLTINQDYYSIECETFEKTDKEQLITQLKKLGFLYDKNYQKTVDSTLL